MSKDILDAAERLAEILSQENDALKRLDFVAAVALVPAKEQAVAHLGKQLNAETIPEPVILLQERLSLLARENQELLERAITVQTRVVRIVARACTARPVVARYGSHATPTLLPRSATPLTLSTRA
jgi:hypothetical protein